VPEDQDGVLGLHTPQFLIQSRSKDQKTDVCR
jgi:hypothetical protein